VDLREFLTARLDEDEAVARAAADLPVCAVKNWGPADRWSHRPIDFTADNPKRAIHLLTPGFAESTDSGVDLIRDGDGITREVADHIVTWDPARVLAEIKAKRRVLARHHPYRDDDPEHGDNSCVGCGFGSDEESMVADINDCPELRDVAAPYAEHPDYDPAWSVDG
jgi:hypothetical protein